MGFYQGTMCAIVLNAVILPGKVWMATLSVMLGAQLMWHRYLFRLPTFVYGAIFVSFMAYVTALGFV